MMAAFFLLVFFHDFNSLKEGLDLLLHHDGVIFGDKIDLRVGGDGFGQSHEIEGINGVIQVGLKREHISHNGKVRVSSENFF